MIKSVFLIFLYSWVYINYPFYFDVFYIYISVDPYLISRFNSCSILINIIFLFLLSLKLNTLISCFYFYSSYLSLIYFYEYIQ